jgi:hypothetical protein
MIYKDYLKKLNSFKLEKKLYLLKNKEHYAINKR